MSASFSGKDVLHTLLNSALASRVVRSSGTFPAKAEAVLVLACLQVCFDALCRPIAGLLCATTLGDECPISRVCILLTVLSQPDLVRLSTDVPKEKIVFFLVKCIGTFDSCTYICNLKFE